MRVTEELRKIPLFTLLQLDEDVQLTEWQERAIVGIVLTTLTPPDLHHLIEAEAFLGLDTAKSCTELVWQDPTVWVADEISNLLAPVIRNELRTHYPGKCNGIVRCDRTQTYTCQELAAAGALRMLQWLHENGFPWDEATCGVAVRGGHLETLQWLHENGCPWDVDTCWEAAAGGHIDVLQYARHNGCPWNADTCWAAVGGGHFETLQYLHENGCPK